MPKPTDQELDSILDIGAALIDGDSRVVMGAIADAYKLPPNLRVELMPLLLDLVASTRLGPHSYHNPYGAPQEGQVSIAAYATDALNAIHTQIPHDWLVPLLLSRQTFDVPDAAFDQSVYIGDYGTRTISTAVMAFHLLPYYHHANLDYADTLAQIVADPTHPGYEKALWALQGSCGKTELASPARLAKFIAAIDELAAIPGLDNPQTKHHRELRALIDSARASFARLK